jgi:ABC-type glycerol-3-phosphate transport system substrate-binding protein
MLYAEQVPAFMEKYPNIKVISEGFTGENYYEKITVLGAGGTLGDAMWTSVGGGGIYNIAAQKLIAPIDPFVAKEKFNLGQ